MFKEQYIRMNTTDWRHIFWQTYINNLAEWLKHVYKYGVRLPTDHEVIKLAFNARGLVHYLF